VALPEPVPALVIRYSYLWRAEYDRGQEEGVKDRPCAVILVSVDNAGDSVVTVLPISHSAPADPDLAVELPAATKRRLGLDDERSWVVLTEANRFVWPGPDLSPARPGDVASIAYGLLPFRLFETVRQKFIAAIRARRTRVVPRDAS
jgi:PemK-like, MazF-like toxin of type II toxin-antitoxin system